MRTHIDQALASLKLRAGGQLGVVANTRQPPAVEQAGHSPPIGGNDLHADVHVLLEEAADEVVLVAHAPGALTVRRQQQPRRLNPSTTDHVQAGPHATPPANQRADLDPVHARSVSAHDHARRVRVQQHGEIVGRRQRRSVCGGEVRRRGEGREPASRALDQRGARKPSRPVAVIVKGLRQPHEALGAPVVGEQLGERHRPPAVVDPLPPLEVAFVERERLAGPRCGRTAEYPRAARDDRRTPQTPQLALVQTLRIGLRVLSAAIDDQDPRARVGKLEADRYPHGPGADEAQVACEFRRSLPRDEIEDHGAGAGSHPRKLLTEHQPPNAVSRHRPRVRKLVIDEVVLPVDHHR